MLGGCVQEANFTLGMHKHFRMMALSQYLRSHGHNADHTRIPGIWAKLGTLYNLPILDERVLNPTALLTRHTLTQLQEDTGIGDWNPEDPEAPNWYPFVLPPEDYSSLQWAQRIADPSASSPPALEHEFSADSEDRPGSRLEIEDSQGKQLHSPFILSANTSQNRAPHQQSLYVVHAAAGDAPAEDINEFRNYRRNSHHRLHRAEKGRRRKNRARTKRMKRRMRKRRAKEVHPLCLRGVEVAEEEEGEAGAGEVEGDGVDNQSILWP